MNRVKILLLPTGPVVLLVLLTHIDGIYAAGVKAAGEGRTSLSNFLGGFFGFVVLVLLVLAIFGFIKNAAP